MKILVQLVFIFLLIFSSSISYAKKHRVIHSRAFQDILWGTDLSQKIDMESLSSKIGDKYCITSTPEVCSWHDVYYKRNNEDLSFYNIPVEEIWYVNYAINHSAYTTDSCSQKHIGGLYRVEIVTNNLENYLQIKAQLFKLTNKKLTKKENDLEDYKYEISDFRNTRINIDAYFKENEKLKGVILIDAYNNDKVFPWINTCS